MRAFERGKCMFQRILVPLDGSPRAEQALPLAARIARATGGIGVLFHVAYLSIEYSPYLVRAPSLSEAVLQEKMAHADSYLAGVASSEEFVGIKTETETIFGCAGRGGAVPVLRHDRKATDYDCVYIFCSASHRL